MTIAQRVKLLLSILSNLKKHAVVSVADLAQQLNMNEADLGHEIEQLLYVGVPPFGGGDLLPIELDADGYICITGDMPSLDRPLRLSDEEAWTLILCLRIAGFTRDDHLVQKLAQAVTVDFDADIFEHIVHICSPHHDTKIFQVLSYALDEGLSVDLHYRNRQEQDSKRRVDPRTLYAEGEAWHLKGFDHKSKQQRSFLLDRILAASLAPGAAGESSGQTPPPEPSTEDSPPFFDATHMPNTCRVKFVNAAAFRADGWPGARLRPSMDEAVVADIPYGDPLWVADKVMALHGQAEVQFPEEMRTAVQASAQTSLERLRGVK
ncbi:MAG: WYL domain-containing protein [Coriobacteriia bacterium]|nr:WYL domain-containing protein [Coriobacteriia bacterium]